MVKRWFYRHELREEPVSLLLSKSDFFLCKVCQKPVLVSDELEVVEVFEYAKPKGPLLAVNVFGVHTGHCKRVADEMLGSLHLPELDFV